MRILYLILFSVFSSICFSMPTGPGKGYTLVHDFKNDWLEYAQDEKAFVPQIKEKNAQNQAHTLNINASDYPYTYILIKVTSSNNFLFINRLLQQKLPENKWVVFSINQLRQISKKDLISLSIYGDPETENKMVLAGFPASELKNIAQTKKSSFLNYFPRNAKSYQSEMAVIFLLCVTMMSFLATNYTKSFKKFFDFNDFGRVVIKEKNFLLNKPLDRPNLFFVILLSIITGFILIILQSKGLDYFSGQWFFQSGDSFGTLIANFFKLGLTIFVFLILKFFLISLVAALFNIEKVIELHYFKIIQTTLLAYSVVLIFLLISQNLYINLGANLKEIILIFVSVFYILRTIIIYFTINRTGNLKTLYIISYLCIVEMLPILIGIRILS